MARKLSRCDFLKHVGLALVAVSIVLTSCAPAATPTAAPTATPKPTEAAPLATPTEAPPAPKFKKTELTVPLWWAPHEIEGAQYAFDTFFTPETGIKVNFEFVGSDYFAKVFTSLASGDPYDAVTINADNCAQFVERGAALALDDLIARDNLDLSDFDPQAIAQCNYDGTQYGLTNDMGSTHCFFNVDLFKKAGLEPPKSTDDWTWDQLLEWSRALTVKEGDQVVQYGFASAMDWMWEAWPNFNGTYVFDEKLSKSLLDDPKVIEAFQFYQDLIHKEGTALQPGAIATAVADLFIAGQVAIMLDGTWMVGYLRTKNDEINFTWDVGLPPHNASAAEWYIPAFTAGWVIPTSAQDVEASWEMMKFYMTDYWANEVEFKALSSLPVCKSALEGGGYYMWPDLPPEGITKDFYVKMLEHARSRRHLKYDLGNVAASMGKLSLIYSGERDAADLLPELAEEVNKGLAERPWNK